MEAERRPPTFVMRRLAFDETGQKVTLTLPGASEEQQTSVYQVLVLF